MPDPRYDVRVQHDSNREPWAVVMDTHDDVAVKMFAMSDENRDSALLSAIELVGKLNDPQPRMTRPLTIEICGGDLGKASKMPCRVHNLPIAECKIGSLMRQKALRLKGESKVLHTAAQCYREDGDKVNYLKARDLSRVKKAEADRILCGTCYAGRGKSSIPMVVAAQYRHLAAITHPRWSEAMAYMINVEGEGYFRWHTSGDVQSLDHFEAICDVAVRCPDTKFWLPTKELGVIKAYMAKHGGEVWPANLQVNYSHPTIDPERLPTLPNRVGCHIVSRNKFRADLPVCPAHENGNKCGTCRACWGAGGKAPVNQFPWH